MGKKQKNIKNSLILISIGMIFLVFGFGFLFTDDSIGTDLCLIPACPEGSKNRTLNLLIAIFGIVFLIIGLDRLIKRAKI